MRVDVTEAMRKVLEDEGYTVSLKRFDTFTGKEGIILRRVLPTRATKYMDTTRSYNFIVHVIVRRRSEAQAMDECCAIADLLEDCPIPSLNGSYTWTATDVYTEPEEMVLDEENFYAWNTRIDVRIERG